MAACTEDDILMAHVELERPSHRWPMRRFQVVDIVAARFGENAEPRVRSVDAVTALLRDGFLEETPHTNLVRPTKLLVGDRGTSSSSVDSVVPAPSAMHFRFVIPPPKSTKKTVRVRRGKRRKRSESPYDRGGRESLGRSLDLELARTRRIKTVLAAAARVCGESLAALLGIEPPRRPANLYRGRRLALIELFDRGVSPDVLGTLFVLRPHIASDLVAEMKVRVETSPFMREAYARFRTELGSLPRSRARGR